MSGRGDVIDTKGALLYATHLYIVLAAADADAAEAVLQEHSISRVVLVSLLQDLVAMLPPDLAAPMAAAVADLVT